VLAPLAEREILYRLLRGDQTARMSQIACAESRLQDVNRAISWIKRNFRAAFSVDTLASEARMSASALHQYFKTVTGTSRFSSRASPAAGGTATDAEQGSGRRGGSAHRRLRESIAVQPRVPALIRSAAGS